MQAMERFYRDVLPEMLKLDAEDFKSIDVSPEGYEPHHTGNIISRARRGKDSLYDAIGSTRMDKRRWSVRDHEYLGKQYNDYLKGEISFDKKRNKSKLDDEQLEEYAYEVILEEEEIDGTKLLRLITDEMREFGFTDISHRVKKASQITDEISKLEDIEKTVDGIYRRVTS